MTPNPTTDIVTTLSQEDCDELFQILLNEAMDNNVQVTEYEKFNAAMTLHVAALVRGLGLARTEDGRVEMLPGV